MASIFARLKEFLLLSVAAFIFWTLALTPFMLLPQPSWLPLPIFVGMNWIQYRNWLFIQAIIVPPLGALSAYFFRAWGKLLHLD